MPKVRDVVKDHKDHKKLHGLKVRTKKNVVGFVFSIGQSVVFLNNNSEKTNQGQLYPQIVLKDEDIMDWEIASDNAPCNCDMLKDHKYTFND